MDITRRLLQLVGAATVVATRRARRKPQPKLRIASVTAWQVTSEKTWSGARWV